MGGIEIDEGLFIIKRGLHPAALREPCLDPPTTGSEVLLELPCEGSVKERDDRMRLRSAPNRYAIGIGVRLRLREPAHQVRRQKGRIAGDAKKPWGSDCQQRSVYAGEWTRTIRNAVGYYRQRKRTPAGLVGISVDDERGDLRANSVYHVLDQGAPAKGNHRLVDAAAVLAHSAPESASEHHASHLCINRRR
jgi:hypothetical protein